jgi:hypothetical protein
LKRRHVIQSVKPKRNQFPLGPSVRSYLQYRCGRDSEAEADFHQERALKEAANRELRQILVQQTRALLHYAKDVEAIQADSNADIRCRISKFGNQLSLQIAGKTDPTEVKTIIDEKVRKVLLQLSRYDPQDYYRRSKISLMQSSSGQEQQPAGSPQPGWPKGKPRGGSPHPWASAANKKRWQSDPEALARTVRAMNDAKLAAADKVRRKLSRAAKKRWQTIPLEQKLAHMAKMRAARSRQKSPSR